MLSSILPRQLRSQCHARRLAARLFASPTQREDVETVPEVGWLWQANRGAGGTKASLRKDNFNPKK